MEHGVPSPTLASWLNCFNNPGEHMDPLAQSLPVSRKLGFKNRASGPRILGFFPGNTYLNFIFLPRYTL